MGMTEKVLLCLAGLLVLAAVLRLLTSPLRLAVKVMVNTLLGFAALWLVNRAAPLTGAALGMNVWNALTVGVLGVPGLLLLVLLRLLFI